MRKRIWELDALRGICILGMVAVHIGYDLGGLGYGTTSPLFLFVQNWGGTLFLVLSGICVTLGKHHLRRGLLVLGCGMLCTLVTLSLYLLGFADKGLIIYFGVLHCLGVCMLLWSLFSRLPGTFLSVLACLFSAVGLRLAQTAPVTVPWLIPLGFQFPGFASSDYFPLLPNLGYFLFGALLGRRLYRVPETRLPRIDPHGLPIRFLCLCGRHSLPIYLLHQPVIAGILAVAIPIFS